MLPFCACVGIGTGLLVQGAGTTQILPISRPEWWDFQSRFGKILFPSIIVGLLMLIFIIQVSVRNPCFLSPSKELPLQLPLSFLALRSDLSSQLHTMSDSKLDSMGLDADESSGSIDLKSEDDSTFSVEKQHAFISVLIKEALEQGASSLSCSPMFPFLHFSTLCSLVICRCALYSVTVFT